jgi:hypothetical protein
VKIKFCSHVVKKVEDPPLFCCPSPRSSHVHHSKNLLPFLSRRLMPMPSCLPPLRKLLGDSRARHGRHQGVVSGRGEHMLVGGPISLSMCRQTCPTTHAETSPPRIHLLQSAAVLTDHLASARLQPCPQHPPACTCECRHKHTPHRFGGMNRKEKG